MQLAISLSKNVGTAIELVDRSLIDHAAWQLGVGLGDRAQRRRRFRRRDDEHRDRESQPCHLTRAPGIPFSAKQIGLGYD